MDKKEYIIKLLESLKKDWEPAKGLLVLLEKNAFDQASLDNLILVFKDLIKEVKNKGLKEKLDKSLEVIQKVKVAETEQNQLDEKDLEDLEKILDNQF